jgi:OmpR-family two-component system manganese-sensing response regulator
MHYTFFMDCAVETGKDAMTVRVLVVEDNEDLVRLYKAAFEQRGYEVHEARSAARAIEILGDVVPTFAIVDIEMPDALGRRAIDYIRSDPRFKDTKIAVITANENYREKLQDDIDRFVVKPIGLIELLDIADKFTVNAQDE